MSLTQWRCGDDLIGLADFGGTSSTFAFVPMNANDSAELSQPFGRHLVQPKPNLAWFPGCCTRIYFYFCLLLICMICLPSAPLTAASTRSQFQVGECYHVMTREDSNGYLLLPKEGQKELERIEIKDGFILVKYRERLLPTTEPKTIRSLRLYDEVLAQRNIAGQKQHGALRPEVQRIIIFGRNNLHALEHVYSPDGPLEWPELQLIGTHVYVPALLGLLPPHSGATNWSADPTALKELLSLVLIEKGDLRCTPLSEVQSEGRSWQRIHFQGEVLGRGLNDRSRHHVNGALFLEPETGRIGMLRAEGILHVLGPKDEILGEIKSDYQLMITPIKPTAALADEKIAALPTKPAESDLDLLWENQDFGLRLIHPRSWMLESGEVQKNGIFFKLDQDKGAVVINVELDDQTPSLEDFYDGVRKELKRNKQPMPEDIALIKSPPDANGDWAGTFEFATTNNQGRPEQRIHWVLRRGKRGITVAASCPLSEKGQFAAGLQRMVYQLIFTTNSYQANTLNAPGANPGKTSASP